MKRLPLLLVSLAVCALSLVFAAEDEPGFTSLFDGKTFEGWDARPGAWEVRDGAIRSTGEEEGGKNWIIWRGGELRDFELRLQFRFTSGNSGVQVRSEDLGDWQVRGYQVEVAPSDKMGLWHHSLSPEKYRSHLATAGQHATISADGEKKVLLAAAATEVQAYFKENDWNEMVVIARGPELVQKINGRVFATLVDEDKKYARAAGVLAFQDHGKGTVAEFKDIRLKVLKE